MGKRYETTVSMPIQYTNMPSNKVLAKSPPTSVQVKMEARGFTLLRHKIKLTINPINFNIKAFTNVLMNDSTENVFKIASDKYIPQFSKQVSSEISILDIEPDTIYFVFDKVVMAKKKVHHQLNLTFENQFFLLDSVAFEPDSVIVRGPKSIVDTLTYVFIKNKKIKQLKSSLRKNVYLNEVDKLDFEPRKVAMTIPVSQYTEYNESIPISKLNVPDSLKLITLPGKVEINCLVALTDYKNLSASSFTIGVDFNDISENLNSLPLRVYRTPGHIKMLKFYPDGVKFIIEKK